MIKGKTDCRMGQLDRYQALSLSAWPLANVNAEYTIQRFLPESCKEEVSSPTLSPLFSDPVGRDGFAHAPKPETDTCEGAASALINWESSVPAAAGCQDSRSSVSFADWPWHERKEDQLASSSSSCELSRRFLRTSIPPYSATCNKAETDTQAGCPGARSGRVSSTPGADHTLASLRPEQTGSERPEMRRKRRSSSGRTATEKKKTPIKCSKHERTRRTRLRPQDQLVTGKRKYRCETCSQILDKWVEENGLKLSGTDKKALLDQVGMSKRQLDNWFCNRRRLERISQQEKSDQSDSFSPEEEDGVPALSPEEVRQSLEGLEEPPTADESLELSSPLALTPLQHLPDDVFATSASFVPATNSANVFGSFPSVQAQLCQQRDQLFQPRLASCAMPVWSGRHQSAPEGLGQSGFLTEQQMAMRRASAPTVPQSLWQSSHQARSNIRLSQPAVLNNPPWMHSAPHVSPTGQWQLQYPAASVPTTTLNF